MFITSILSGTVIPFLLGAFFLQKTNPLHRFLAKVLEIRVKLEWRYLPLILFSTWAFLVACSFGAFCIALMIMYLSSMSFWLSSLQPLRLSIGIGGNQEKTSKFRTLLGDLSVWKILKIYRSLQVLNRQQTSCLATPRFASHQSLFHIATVVCAFCSIRYFDIIFSNLGYIMLFFGVGICLLIEFVETRIISYMIQASRHLIRKMEQLLRKETLFQGKLMMKEVRASWALRVDVAYPYYEVSRHTFWEFVDVALHFLVDALLTY